MHTRNRNIKAKTQITKMANSKMNSLNNSFCYKTSKAKSGNWNKSRSKNRKTLKLNKNSKNIKLIRFNRIKRKKL